MGKGEFIRRWPGLKIALFGETPENVMNRCRRNILELCIAVFLIIIEREESKGRRKK